MAAHETHRLGAAGEARALELLQARGHRLLERNFRCPRGELDLVTWQGDTLVFTEVKVLTETAYMHASERVDEAKREKLRRAAHWYLKRRAGKEAPPPHRFDIVWLTAKEGKFVDHGIIENAFGDGSGGQR
ncbi:MAG: YraN family protein [Planctomycetes bacterium]|nr:YraN family protein [Planctomycetota bacterium]